MPGTRRRSATGQPGQPVDEVVERGAFDPVALHAELRHAERALQRGGEVADRAAQADDALGTGSHSARSSLARDVVAQARELLAAAGPVVRQEALGHPHRAQAPGVAGRSRCRSRTRTSCSEPPPMSSTAPSRRSVEFTAAR